MPLPTDRTASDTIEEHVDDHNTLATQHNELEGHAADTSVHGIADTSALSLNTHDHDTDYEPLGAAAAAAAAVVDAAPGALDTLNELAAALGDDANYASTVTTALAGKASTSHHTSHEPGGSDTMAADAAAGTASLRSLGTGATQAAAGNDARLSDTRIPTDGSVTNAKVDAAAAIAETKLSLASDAAAGTASRRSLGSGATQAAAGNHAHSGTYEPSGTVATHAAAADPHTGYVLESLLDAAGDLITATANDTPAKLSMGSALQVLRVNAGATALEYATPASGGGGSAFYGDGSDGVVNFDGTTTLLGLVPSSGTYTLARDIFLADGSQLSSTAKIDAKGYRIHCNGTLTVGASAQIHHNGGNGAGSTGASAKTAGTLPLTYAGANGGTGAGTQAGAQSATSAGGGSGGAGGTSGANSGGASRAVATLTATKGSIHGYWTVTTGFYWGAGGNGGIEGGPGGSSGGGDGTNAGGGGGGGGGTLLIAAKGIVNNGTISANGGNGGNGVAGNAAGGGGGGGGIVFLTYNTYSGNAATATGGTKGTNQGTSTGGGNGSNGNVVTLVNA